MAEVFRLWKLYASYWPLAAVTLDRVATAATEGTAGQNVAAPAASDWSARRVRLAPHCNALSRRTPISDIAMAKRHLFIAFLTPPDEMTKDTETLRSHFLFQKGNYRKPCAHVCPRPGCQTIYWCTRAKSSPRIIAAADRVCLVEAALPWLARE